MDFNDNKAIYIQIAEKIMDEIVSQKYQEGDRIPSVREYAASLEVNANTVMRSYELLDREGIIYNRRGIGFFVKENAGETILDMRRENFYKNEMNYFFSRLESFSISPVTLSSLYQSYLINHKK